MITSDRKVDALIMDQFCYGELHDERDIAEFTVWLDRLDEQDRIDALDMQRDGRVA